MKSLFFFLIPAALMAQAPGDNSFVLKGATVHTMAGAEIQNGTVIVRAGKIIGVGNR
jgi:predicted amidohydrolase YtcJ